MKITCKEAQTICDKGQYEEANFFEQLKLSIHHLYCKKCRKYSKQNAFLSLLLKKCDSLEKLTEKCLSKEEKENLQINVEKEIQPKIK